MSFAACSTAFHKLDAWSSAEGPSTESVVLVVSVQISAKKGTGVDDLLETVALVAELEDLMSNPDRAAAGTVLEAYLDKRIGAISTLLVQTGTLHVGDIVVTGSAYGKVRRLAHRSLAAQQLQHQHTVWTTLCPAHNFYMSVTIHQHPTCAYIDNMASSALHWKQCCVEAHDAPHNSPLSVPLLSNQLL